MRYKNSVINIAFIGMVLGLMILAKFIQKFIPDLPNGLGDVTVLMEIFIVLASLVVGGGRTLIATLIYICLFAGLDISTFMGGLLGVDKPITKFGVYLLDYFIPLVALALAGLFANKNIFINMATVVTCVAINYTSHVISGIVFGGDYAGEGGGVGTYSLAANGIRNGVMLGLSIVIVPLALKAIRPHLVRGA